jgi:hypothetical protein
VYIIVYLISLSLLVFEILVRNSREIVLEKKVGHVEEMCGGIDGELLVQQCDASTACM